MKAQNKLALAAAASLALGAACMAQAPRRAAPPSAAPAAAETKVGLSAILDNDDKVIAEVVGRNMTSLQDYLFKKNNVPLDRQEAYKAIVALPLLDDPKIKPAERARITRTISLGIDNILKTINDARRLMQINSALVIAGTQRPLNILEYWPEGSNPKVQAQVRPIAEAIDRVYEKAIDVGDKEATRIANSMTPANQGQLAPQWEKAQSLVGLAKFSRGNNLYTLALSMDKADPERAKAALKGVAIIKEYEDPVYEIPWQAKLAMGKLFIAAGPASAGQGKAKLDEVIKANDAPWGQKFEAMYFLAVGDVVDGKFPEAEQDKTNLEKWLTSSPPPINDPAKKEEALKGTRAALDMLQYRILSAQAESAQTNPADRARLNGEAMGVLTKLAAARPDLAAIISEQMMARMPDNPDVSKLDALMLRALLHRADDELVKPEGQAVDQKALAQGTAAAREIMRRKASAGLTADDVDLATISLAVFYSRLGQDGNAANAYLDYLELFNKEPDRRELAYQGALAAVGKLQRDKKDDPITQDVYMRFLKVATAKPLEKKEFNLEYGTALVKRNVLIMQGTLTPAQRETATANGRRAVELLRAVPDPKKRIYARFYEMLAFDQLIDLDRNRPEVPQEVMTIQKLGDEVNKIAADEEAGADAGFKETLRLFRVRTNVLLGNLAEEDKSPKRKEHMQHSLDLLANFEKDAEGLPNADNLIGEVRNIRIKFLMALGKPQQALDDLGKFVQSSGDRAVPVVYEMLKALNEDYHRALDNKDDAEADELARDRAMVSEFMVSSARQSTDATVKKLLPKYEVFMADAYLEAARREKDAAKRGEFLKKALAIFKGNLEKTPDDYETELKMAVAEFELGDYGPAQTHFGELIAKNQLGRPKVQQKGTNEMVWNDLFWQGRLMLLQSILKLVDQKAVGFGPDQLEQVRTDLKRLYIQWGEPGGPKWFPEFEALRKQLLPDWTPPPLEDTAPSTQPATRPVAVK
jgi:hypothetical protein